jgi:hypothetical protein
VGTNLCSLTSTGVSSIQHFLETAEAMPFSQENQEWIMAKIQEALRPNGWKRFANWLRYWGLIGVAVTAFLALIAIAITLGISALSGRTQEATFRGSTEQWQKTTEDIESGIKEIREQLTSQSLAAYASLPLRDFKATLPDLRSSVAAARQQNVKVPPKVVDDLAQKMTAIDTNAPQFWPLAASLISYRASLLVGGSGNWTLTSFPPCNGPVDLDRAVGMPQARLTEDSCYAELDGKKISRWDCIRCLVKYSGGPVSLRDVHFQGCLFVFDFQSKPATPDGERLSKTLLASESQNVSLPAS